MNTLEIYNITDWKDASIRGDLRLARIIENRCLSYITVITGRVYGEPYGFQIGNTRIWATVMGPVVGYQIADIVNGMYENHRGFSSSLNLSINQVLAEQDLPLLQQLVRVGDSVYWNDPDRGLSSGFYTVEYINSESGEVDEDDTIISIANKSGSHAEVYPNELVLVE